MVCVCMCVRACTHACVYVRAHAHVCVCAHIAQVVLSNIPQCCFLIFFEYHYTHKVETFLFNAEHEIRTEKCSDITRNMYCSITFWLRHLSDQNGICTGQHQKLLL